MKASETKVEDFLSSNKTQFIIPVYQRNYDWSISQCKLLLDDILEVGTNKKMNAHFIGSIVYVHDDVYTASRIKELTVIDGQQRVTTLTLIYLVLHRLAQELKEEKLVNEISETYLINKFAPEEEKLKLRPTDNNDKALKYLLRGDANEEYSDFSKLIDNFNYFKGRITEDNYQIVLTGLSKLMFVEISLDRERDEPQRIFESLNSTGLELSQADLIRNYILMGLKRREQNKIYQNYWEVIEKLAKDEILNVSRVSDFIRDYLTVENNNIPNKGRVYFEFKSKYPTSTLEELESNLSGIKSLGKHYNKLINPKNEPDKEIRLQLEYINRLEINVAYPFLMKVYDDYSNSIIDKATFLKVLDTIQSFTWRRFIVGLPTNALNKIFMNLYDKVERENYLYSIQKALLQRAGVQRYPKNEETIDALKVKDVYNIKAKNRIYLLERLENYDNREHVAIDGNPDITIEHIFPQNPDTKWKIELGNDEYSFIKENYLNTIGNLTLSGNNGKLGNKPFLEKRDKENDGYKDSRLWLNKYLSVAEKWDRAEIERRFGIIAERFLKIWELPTIAFAEDNGNNEVNIFEAEDPKFKKLEYAIFLDQKLEIRAVSQLYVEVFKQLFELQPETFFTSDIGLRIGLTKNPVEGSPRQPIAINDTYFIESNLDNIGKFDRIKQALTLLNLEDELTIKYANENAEQKNQPDAE
ncbi:MAG: DUF262 domain-containing protein [Candidatus Kuenenia sp.]|uniref:DUF262 domain-containing protein n=1 Tax=Kuenenia stuttgartiensis TaxID=174633 RepID=A0A2C9CJV5_KUEST|nr:MULTISPECIES: DUF262 domain-containing protein [Kuenenia]MCZ7611944.1 DUF262 domain-containing protein [Ignavibacterium sp.]MCZ7620936.1 DUF262 domain-containing protein [Candidatus Kuenenia sp.]SOH05878.1 hypothetical protein KSMBR1_3404 [Candidatus Kuenenia stuttgartiensis]